MGSGVKGNNIHVVGCWGRVVKGEPGQGQGPETLWGGDTDVLRRFAGDKSSLMAQRAGLSTKDEGPEASLGFDW